MGHHWGHNHKKHGTPVLQKIKRQDEKGPVARGGYSVLPELEENTLPRDIHMDGKSPQNVEQGHVARQSHGHGHADAHYIHARQAEPESGTVVTKTIVHVVRPDGLVVGTFTVGTLPATVSNSNLGVVTIPKDTNSPVTAPSAPKTTLTPQTTPVSASSTNSASSVSSSTIDSDVSTSSSIPKSSSIFPLPLPASANSTTSILSATSASSETELALTSPTGVILIPSLTSTSSSLSSPLPIPIIPSVSSLSMGTTTATSSLSSSELSVFSVSSSTSVLSTSRSSSSSTLLSTSSSSTISTSSLTSSSSVSTSTSSSSSTSSLTTSASSSESYFPGGGAPIPTGGPIPPDNSGPSSTSTPAPAPAPSRLPPPSIIGAIVGSVSGFVVILLMILFILRSRRKKSSAIQALPEGSGETPAMGESTARGGPPTSPRSSAVIANFLAPARAFGRWRNSSQSFRSEDLAPPAQRGFEKLGGRKLAPVLLSGGDGYDNQFGSSSGLSKELGVGVATSSYDHPLSKETGHSRAPIPSPPLGRPASQESDSSTEVLFRPSPARAITTLSPSTVPADTRASKLPMPQRPSMRVSHDGIGRSHLSADGSRTSRFTEGV